MHPYSTNSPWLENLQFTWDEVIAIGSPSLYQKNEVVFLENDLAEYVYIVKQGRIRLFLTSVSGNEKALAVIGQNGLLMGELSSTVKNNTYKMSAITASPAELIKVNNKHFWDFIINKPHYVKQVIEILNLKINLLTSHSVQLAYGSSYNRVCETFLHLAFTYGKKMKDNQIKIMISFTHQEIADLIGVTRVSVANHIKQLIVKGFLSKNGPYYTVMGCDGLRKHRI